jgi:hypothetical protein
LRSEEDRLSWDFVPYDTSRPGRSGSPGAASPGTFRPQGLVTLSTAYSLPGLATARRPPQRPWGSPFRALLLPACGTPLGASPLLSFHYPPPKRWAAATPEVDSDREGGRWPPPEGGGRRTLPSWVFAPPGHSPPSPLDRLPGPKPLTPFRPEVLPTFPLPGGAPGVCVRRKRLVSLETAGPHEVPHLSESNAPLWAADPPGIWFHLGPKASEEGWLPDRSSARGRLGAMGLNPVTRLLEAGAGTHRSLQSLQGSEDGRPPVAARLVALP